MKSKLLFRTKLKLLLVFFIFLGQSEIYLSQNDQKAKIDLTETHFGSKFVKSTDRKLYDLESFSSREKQFVTAEIKSVMGSDMENHPDYGFATHRIYPEAIELLNKRTANSTAYMFPDGKTIFSSSESSINYQDENGWFREISNKISPFPDGNVYRNLNSPTQKSIDVSNGKTSYHTSLGDFTLNQSTKLKIQNGQNITDLGSFNASDYKIGENGMFIKNAYPGIDIQIIFQEHGAVKTNYIITDRSVIPNEAEFLLFEDVLTLPEGLNLSYDDLDGIFNGNEQDWEGSLVVRDNLNTSLFFFEPALTYDKNYADALAFASTPTFDKASESMLEEGVNSDAFTYGAYRFERISSTKYKVTLVVSVAWLNDETRAFPVVVDPTTFTGNSIDMTTRCAVRISGTTPADDPRATYGGVGCHTTTTVLPAGYMLITNQYPVIVQSGYVSTGCVMGNTFQTFYGPCGKDPRAAGFFWFCNTMTFAGTCTGSNIRMDGILSRCTVSNDGELCSAATPPSCSDQTLNFTMCYQTRCTGGTAGSCYATTGSPSVRGTGIFRVDIVGEKITTTVTSAAGASGVNVCPNSVQNLASNTQFGVPAALSTANCTNTMGGTYTYAWTQTAGAAATIATPTAASTNITTPAVPGVITFQLTTCNTACPTPAGTMCDVQTFSFTVGDAVTPTAIDVIACNGQTASVTVTNPQGGYVYTWYDGPSIVSPVLGTGITRTVGPYSDVTRQYTVRATTPCNSTPITINVTWGPVPTPVTTSTTICPNTSATLLADCGGNCQWFTAPAGGTSFNNTGTYVTPSLTATTTYYVQFVSGTCSSGRIPVSATIGALTVNATPVGPTQVCTPTTQPFNVTLSGGTTTAFDQVVSNSTSSGVAPSGSSCIDPGDAGCTGGNGAVSRTITAPTFISNPIDANTIQSICFTSTNGCAQDLKVWLQSPSGTIFTLATQKNKSKSSAYNVCWTVSATGTMPNADGSCNSGNYIPDGGALNSAFIGENPTGTWTLWIADARGGGGCSTSIAIDNFSMTFRRDPPMTYLWSGAPVGQLSGGAAIPNPTFTTATGPAFYDYTYTITVTDKRGCVGSNTVNVLCPNPLPVKLIDFDGYSLENGNLLHWTTASEQNSKVFEIESSLDGVTFTKIGEVAATGNSTSDLYYNFLDEKANRFKNYYRLKQIDINGEFEYSKIILISSDDENQLIVMPNPTKDKMELIFNSNSFGKSEIRIMDVKGKVIDLVSTQIEKGLNKISYNAGSLSPGIYTITINNNDKIVTKKFVKN